jgi:hypothetical protein
MCELSSFILSLLSDSLIGIIGAAAGAIIADRIARNGERKRNSNMAQSQLFPILDDVFERIESEDDMRRIRDESVKFIGAVVYQISPLLGQSEIDSLRRAVKDFKNMQFKTADQIVGGMVNDILDAGTAWPHLIAERELIKESVMQIKRSLTRRYSE